LKIYINKHIKKFIIIGGYSGMGEVIVENLATAGYNIIATYITDRFHLS